MDKQVFIRTALASALAFGALSAAHAGPVAPDSSKQKCYGIAKAGATEFWELGPGGVLSGLARRTDKSWNVRSVSEYADLGA